jgi:hypothetical protein
MKLTDLIPDLNRLETELGSFERHFGVKSAEFYEAMNNGGDGRIRRLGRFPDGIHRLAFAVQDLAEPEP